MGNFQDRDNRGGNGGGYRGGNGGGRGDFKKKSWGGGNDRGGDREVTMHKAVCSECHKNCEVPFFPSGDKPVYCSDCFSAKREGGDRGGRKDFGDRGPRKDFGDRQAPRPDFTRSISVAPNGEMKKQLEEINNKLNRLIGILEKNSGMKVEVEAKKEEPTKATTLKSILKKVVGAKTPAKKEKSKKKK